MTTPGPEPGRPPATDEATFAVQPPAWSGWYTGPAFDDTAWHLDLTGVDWGDRDPGTDDWRDEAVEPVTDPRWKAQPRFTAAAAATDSEPFPHDEQRHSGNGFASGRGAGQEDDPANSLTRPVRRPRDYTGRPDRQPGGRGRHARPEPTRPLTPDGSYLDRSPSTVRPRAPGVDWRHPERRPVAGRPPAGRASSVHDTITQAVPGGAQAAVVRSSGVMAVGTLGSRLTGFLRTLVQNYALGVALLGSAYNLSNTLPNVVYNLALGGILTSVIVPLIVTAGKRESDRGQGYDQRMFTLVTVALGGVTVLAMALVVPIVALYSGTKITGTTEHLAVIWALFFIPQIFFYGVSSLIAAILNSRDSFAAPMWTPIVNNIVVIGVLGAYAAMAGVHKQPGTISGGQIQFLGLGTTLGIVAQTVALLPALRRVGFRWHPRLDFRRREVREIGRMAGWMFGYIAATQIAFLITTKLAGDTTDGISDYNYAWLLFQLPYAVVGISVITALLPRMSAHASERRFGLVRSDFSTGVRLASAIVVPCSLVLAALGPALGQVFFGHGATNTSSADYVGVVFAVFCLGLTPYMLFQLQLRVFYSLHDSKTPALIGLVTMTVNIVANLIALNSLPKSELVAGLGFGFGLANLVGTVIAWRILRVRLRGLDGWRIGRSLVRMHAATLPAALVVVVTGMLSGNAIVTVVFGGGLALLVYLLFARALRIEELSNLSRAMLGRLAHR